MSENHHQKMKLVIENTFSPDLKLDSDEIGISVYRRVFKKLLDSHGSLGKVQPIYFRIDGEHKVFGIVTINKSGSFSFFPELPGDPFFDHVTFNRDLSKNEHHFTRVSDKKREKVLPLHAQHLSNNMYHAVSFSYNSDYLRVAPKYVHYPEIPLSDCMEVQDAFFVSSKTYGSTVVDLHDGGPAIHAQFFLIPADVDVHRMKPYVGVYKGYENETKVIEVEYLKMACAVIPHVYQEEYVLGLGVFRGESMQNSVFIGSAASKNGFFQKLNMPLTVSSNSPLPPINDQNASS